MNEENGRSSGFLFVSEGPSVSRVIRCLQIGTYLSNKGLIYLLIFTYLLTYVNMSPLVQWSPEYWTSIVQIPMIKILLARPNLSIRFPIVDKHLLPSSVNAKLCTSVLFCCGQVIDAHLWFVFDQYEYTSFCFVTQNCARLLLENWTQWHNPNHKTIIYWI